MPISLKTPFLCDVICKRNVGPNEEGRAALGSENRGSTGLDTSQSSHIIGEVVLSWIQETRNDRREDHHNDRKMKLSRDLGQYREEETTT